MDLLDSMVIPRLIFGGISIPFSIGVAPFDIPTSNARVFQFLLFFFHPESTMANIPISAYLCQHLFCVSGF